MLLLLSVFGLVVVMDQITKAMIVARLQEGAFTSGIGGVRFRHITNRRTPWGSIRAVRVMMIVWLALVVTTGIAGALIQIPALHIALGALAGGATGNLIDGISRNGVTDFIDLRVWPVFNLADAAIVAGAVFLVWTLFHVQR